MTPGARAGRPPYPRILLLLLLLLLSLLFSAPVRSEDCADCHDIDPGAFAATVHGPIECAACHPQQETVPHPEGSGRVDCAACHDGEVREYGESVHGRAGAAGAEGAPDCFSCHGQVHRQRPRSDPESPIHHARLAETCGGCHANPDLVRRYGIHFARPLEAYRASVHAEAVRRGGDAATCSDCHGSHAILPSSDPRSTVFRARVPETCGACHAEIAALYRTSVHGRAAAEGVIQAPVCTDCHGEHRILSPRERGSPVYATNIPRMTCGRCHGDLRLAERFGLPADRLPLYEESYHGLANRLGSVVVANCSSCHGVHDILPSSDPDSSVHPRNLPSTCGHCHAGAGENFARGRIHAGGDEPAGPGEYWVSMVRRIYLPLIAILIGGMCAHNAVDFWRRVRTPPEPARSGRQVKRISLEQRLQHGILLLAFATLVATGFALKYPEAWWVRRLHLGEAVRGTLHRIAGATLAGLALYHAASALFTRRGRGELRALLPRRGDLGDALGQMAFNAGLRAAPPRHGRFRYEENVEYWALAWGSLLMAVTGGLLWFENLALRFLPKWALDVVAAVHLYEAWLATLAILVWHLYFVIFRPGVYPMNWSWLTGRVPEEYLREEHRLEWERESGRFPPPS